jgi:hypothetical protein
MFRKTVDYGLWTVDCGVAAGVHGEVGVGK